LRGSNCGSPYEVQRQSPLNQLTIDVHKLSLVSILKQYETFWYNEIVTLPFVS
jgi:hypothetical protein